MRRNRFAQLIILILVCLLSALPAVYAAPPKANQAAAANKIQSSAPKAQQGPKANITKPSPLQPPASITMTSPTAGMILPIGFNSTVSWTGTGPAGQPLGPVDITLWKGSQQVAVLASSVAGPSVLCAIPQTLTAGAYELRIVSKNYPEAKASLQMNAVIVSTVTFTEPKQGQTLLAGTQQTISWTYSGNPGPLKFNIEPYSGGTAQQIAANVPYTAGSKTFTVPGPYQGLRYRIVAYAADNKWLAATGYFDIALPEINVTAPSANYSWEKGKSGTINWNCSHQNGTVNIDLLNNATYQTVKSIAAGVPITQKTMTWTPDNSIPNGTYFIRVSSPSLNGWGDSGKFTIKDSPPPPPTQTTPYLTITGIQNYSNQYVTNVLALSGVYRIVYVSQLPASYSHNVKIEVVGAADNQLLKTLAASYQIPQRGNMPAISGTVNWDPAANFPNDAYGKSYKIRITSLGNPQYVVNSQPFILKYSANSTTPPSSSGSSTSSSSSGSNTSSSSSSNTSTTTGSTNVNTSSSSSNTGSPTTRQLTQDTSLNYSATRTALFKKNTTVQLGANGYVVSGLIKGNQTLYYHTNKTAYFMEFAYATNFSNGFVQDGYLAGAQTLEFAPGKSALFRNTGWVAFSNGYVREGWLENSQALPYRSGKTARFRGMSKATFSNGYVVKGQLDGNDQYLEYASNKPARFSTTGMTEFRSDGYVQKGTIFVKTTLQKTTGEYVEVPGLSVVQFDNSGRLVSYNPPLVNIK